MYFHLAYTWLRAYTYYNINNGQDHREKKIQ